MAEVIRVYREDLPEVILVGKAYHDEDRVNGLFSPKWDDWFANGWFDIVENCGTPLNAGWYLGAMREQDGKGEYWIGMMMTDVSAVPDGFTSIAFPAGGMAVAWIRGEDGPALYSMHESCMAAFAQEGFPISDHAWFIERYACPRFTQPDGEGRVILDYMVSLAR